MLYFEEPVLLLPLGHRAERERCVSSSFLFITERTCVFRRTWLVAAFDVHAARRPKHVVRKTQKDTWFFNVREFARELTRKVVLVRALTLCAFALRSACLAVWRVPRNRVPSKRCVRDAGIASPSGSKHLVHVVRAARDAGPSSVPSPTLRERQRETGA